jgi:hypothetical protein
MSSWFDPYTGEQELTIPFLCEMIYYNSILISLFFWYFLMMIQWKDLCLYHLVTHKPSFSIICIIGKISAKLLASFIYLFWDLVSLCSPGWPLTWNPVALASIILMPQPSEWWDYRCAPPHLDLTTKLHLVKDSHQSSQSRLNSDIFMLYCALPTSSWLSAYLDSLPSLYIAKLQVILLSRMKMESFYDNFDIFSSLVFWGTVILPDTNLPYLA